MNKKPTHVTDLLFFLSLLCVFTVCGLVVVYMGVSVYQNTTQNMGEAFSERTAMAYIAKKMRQNDASGAISLTEIEGQTALTITQQQGDACYCTYIYYANGYLQELYAKDTFAPTLSAGQALIAIDGLSFTQNADGTLTITILQTDGDAQNLILALQSETV